jgi:hypothetical protein
MLGVIQFSGFIQILCVRMHVLMILCVKKKLELRNERVERFGAMIFDKWEEDERAMRGRRRKKGNFIILVVQQSLRAFWSLHMTI